MHGLALVLLLCLGACGANPGPTAPATPEGLATAATDEFAATTATLAAALRRLPPDCLLSVPTYDGSGQAVHPDILWGRQYGLPYAFYLTLTPYPNSRDRYENPSLLVSDDGLTFRDPAAGLNPLAPAPALDHNSDPDLLYDPWRRVFRLFYMESNRPVYNRLMLLESRDGRRWTRRVALSYDLTAREHFMVSPAVIAGPSGYRLFFVDITAPSHPVVVLGSPDGLRWDRKADDAVVPALPENLPPWHVDVFASDRGYIMLCCGPYAEPRLYLATSDDLQHWAFLPRPILRPGHDFHDTQQIYRSTGLSAGDELAVWYSYKDASGRWGIGLRRFSWRQLNLQRALL